MNKEVKRQESEPAASPDVFTIDITSNNSTAKQNKSAMKKYVGQYLKSKENKINSETAVGVTFYLNMMFLNTALRATIDYFIPNDSTGRLVSYWVLFVFCAILNCFVIWLIGLSFRPCFKSIYDKCCHCRCWSKHKSEEKSSTALSGLKL